MKCYNCKYWSREKGTGWGYCKAFSTGKMKNIVDIVVAGGYSSQDSVRTNGTFYCAVFNNKHGGKT